MFDGYNLDLNSYFPLPIFVAFVLLLVLCFIYRLWNEERRGWTDEDSLIVLRRFSMLTVFVAIVVIFR